jgi:small subunit ribosomal protein S4
MKGNTGESFVGLLERRLDAIVYRMNLAPTIFSARQLVSHGHVLVNGKRVTIASQRLKEGDEVSLKEFAKQMPLVVESISKTERKVPDYLSFDSDSMTGKFVRVPISSDVPYPFEPDVHLVVELYSH